VSALLKPQPVEPGWIRRWWRESWGLMGSAPAVFLLLFAALYAMNSAWQPLVLGIPIACIEVTLVFSFTMAVHGGETELFRVLRRLGQIPWWPLFRLIVNLAVLLLILLLSMLALRQYLGAIFAHDHLSTAASLRQLHTPAWDALPLWLRSLISNSLGNAQILLGNVFLLLSVGVVVAGITRTGYIALLAGFQAVLVNVRVWLGFLLASLALQGLSQFLTARLHTEPAAIFVGLLAVALLQMVGLYGWCFLRESFGLPGRQAQTVRAHSWYPRLRSAVGRSLEDAAAGWGRVPGVEAGRALLTSIYTESRIRLPVKTGDVPSDLRRKSNGTQRQ